MFLDRIAPYLPLYPYILFVWLALSLVLLLAALYNIRRRRTAQVWRNRHRADQRGRRLLLWSVSSLTAAALVTTLSLSVIFAFGYVEEFFPPRNPYGVTGVALTALVTQDPNQTATPTPTRTPSRTATPITPTPIPSPTQIPTDAPSSTPTETETPSSTPSPTPTQTRTKTVTPSPTIPPLARLGITPPFSPFDVPAAAEIRIVAADDVTTDTGTPDSPQRAFTTNTEAIYFFVTYRHMRDDVVWSWVIFRNGLPVSGDAVLWKRGSDGALVFPFEVPDGFPIGEYEARLYLNDMQVQTFAFTVIPPDNRPNSP
jgi:hypothetical protein